MAETKKKAVVSVINDLASDQRVARTCRLLHHMGYEVTLVGRMLGQSPPLPALPCNMVRMQLRFTGGPLFYLEFQWRLFRFLQKHPSDLYFANDLDTLLPNFFACANKEKLVYDSHEFFTGVPELQHRPIKRNIWKLLERMLVPRLKHCITVNASIAHAYNGLYGNAWTVVRNISDTNTEVIPSSRAHEGLPENAFLLVLQGAGINVQRGAEEAVQALALLPPHVYLLVMGSGDVIDQLPAIALGCGVQERLIMKPRSAYGRMMQLTTLCQCGLSLDKPLSDNYRMSLPNKIFDYFRAGLPVVVSPVQEVKALTEQFRAGLVVDAVSPEAIAACVKKLLQDEALYKSLAAGAKKAAEELSWEKEAVKLSEIINRAGN